MTINSELNNNTISSIVTKSDALIQKEPLVGKALGAQSVTPGTQAPGSRRARAIAQEILQRKPKEGNETKLQGRVAPPSPNRPPPPLPKELKKLIDEMRKRPIPPPDLKGLEIPGRGLKLEENLSSTFGIIKNRGAKLSIIGGKLTPTVGETTLENDIEVVSGVLKETKEALNKDILQFKYENQWIPLHHLLRTLASSEQGKSVLRVNKTLRRELRGVLNQAQDQQLATKVLERVKGGSKAPKEVKTLADAQHFMIHQGKIKEFLRCVETTFNHVNRTSSKLKLLSVYRSYIKGISENLFEVDHDLIDQLDKFAGKQDISKALLKDINELRHTSLDKRLAGKVYENMHTDLRLPPEVKTLNQTLKFMVYKGKAREFFESVNKTFSDAKMERSKVKLLQTCRAYLKGVREGLFREDPQLVNQIKEISQKVKNAIKKPTLSQAGGLAKLKSKLQTKLKKTLIDDRDVDRELGLQKDKVFVEAHNLTNFDIGLHYTRSEKLPKLQEKHKPKGFLGNRPFEKS